ncbi:AlkA N-terminal domain-containing protein [soil metagenome]
MKSSAAAETVITADNDLVTGLELDDEARYRAMRTRDARFDGWFFIGVRTTGIYCRPSCPTPVQPKRTNIGFYPTAATAQQAGFRACKRCRPDATPGSPLWNQRADLAGRALRLIGDGAVDHDGVRGLAQQLAVSERHLNRVLSDQVGVGPIALARAQRAQTARLLIETTELPFSEVAFAAGFASIRQFNDTVREVFAATPTALRASSASRRATSRRRGVAPGESSASVDPASSGPAPITVRMAVRQPFDHSHLWAFLAARAIPGLEQLVGDTYCRSLALANGPAIIELTPADDHVRLTARLTDLRDLATAIALARRLLDLDADPVAIDGMLAEDPLLRDLVHAHPGRRSPGAVDPHELAIRAVLGQQITVAAARTVAARLAERFGTALADPQGSLVRLFPSPATLAGVDPDQIDIPRTRARALVGVAAALADGTIVLDPGADRDAAVTALLSLPGIGPWTASYIAMRSLSDPDVILPTDVAVLKGAANLGLPPDPAALAAHATRWAPWRSYATHLLWSASSATAE